MTWWRELSTFAACYHPYSDRYLVCPQVQKCGWCGEVRFASEIGNHWSPVLKPSQGVRAPGRSQLGVGTQQSEPKEQECEHSECQQKDHLPHAIGSLGDAYEADD